MTLLCQQMPVFDSASRMETAATRGAGVPVCNMQSLLMNVVLYCMTYES
jgi:hypothetical protein